MTQRNRSYKILGILGKGGFGTVHRAELLGLGGFTKPVALKVLNAEVSNVEDYAARLRDEARLLGLLRHRAIVQVDGLIMLEGRWTVVMELIEGADLRCILNDNAPMPPGVALEIAQEVASALHAAYDRPWAGREALRVLHRDIKPSNIRITPTGEVKVLDFGVARADFSSREVMTQAHILGSQSYMAPERFNGQDSHAGDVYSLGLVLYECLMGRKLGPRSFQEYVYVESLQSAIDELMDRHGQPELGRLVERSLDWDPDLRPTAHEFERTARTLRASFPEPWLSDWAERHVNISFPEEPATDAPYPVRTLVETTVHQPTPTLPGQATGSQPVKHSTPGSVDLSGNTRSLTGIPLRHLASVPDGTDNDLGKPSLNHSPSQEENLPPPPKLARAANSPPKSRPGTANSSPVYSSSRLASTQFRQGPAQNPSLRVAAENTSNTTDNTEGSTVLPTSGPARTVATLMIVTFFCSILIVALATFLFPDFPALQGPDSTSTKGADIQPQQASTSSSQPPGDSRNMNVIRKPEPPNPADNSVVQAATPPGEPVSRETTAAAVPAPAHPRPLNSEKQSSSEVAASSTNTPVSTEPRVSPRQTPGSIDAQSQPATQLSTEGTSPADIPASNDQGDLESATAASQQDASPGAAEPAVSLQPSPTMGLVTVSGDITEVWLTDERGKHPPGLLEPGTYRIQVVFYPGQVPQETRSISVEAGRSINVTCQSDFGMCAFK